MKMKKSYILSIGIAKYKKSKVKKVPNYISKQDLENSIHSVLGDISIKHEDVFMFVDNICQYKYLENSEKYKLVEGCGEIIMI